MIAEHLLARLRNLSDELEERLAEAENVRTRFVTAHDANSWPDLRAGRTTDLPGPPRFRRSDDNDPTH